MSTTLVSSTLKKFALVAALALPASAFAGPYLVLGGASGKANLDSAASTAGYGAGTQTDDSFGRALVGIGANLTPNLGIEAAYLTEAEASLEDSTTKDTLKNSGFQFAFLAKAPLTPQFSLFGKLSANYMEVKDDHTVAPVTTSDKDTGFHLGFGAGLEYQVTDAVGVRLTAERIQLRDVELFGSGYDVDLDQATLGVQFAF